MDIALALGGAGILIWAVVIYNRLIRDKHRVAAAWSDIDVQLKRRHDLIPKLIDAVKQYAAFEEATLATLTALRGDSEVASDIDKVSTIESKLAGSLLSIVAIAEDYPELKANESFIDLQQNLTDVEEHIQLARRFYNGAVLNLNVRIETFPDVFVARALGFTAAQLFRYHEGST
ncbi:MAG: LemA family protein [Pseudomonadota bacterium]